VTHLRKAMLEELQRRNLSAITTRIYLHSVEEFAQHFKTPPDRLALERPCRRREVVGPGHESLRPDDKARSNRKCCVKGGV
jgi:hypothetical protein